MAPSHCISLPIFRYRYEYIALSQHGNVCLKVLADPRALVEPHATTTALPALCLLSGVTSVEQHPLAYSTATNCMQFFPSV